MKSIIIVLSLILPFYLHDGKISAEEVVRKATAKYESEQYISVNTLYRLYPDYKSKKIHEEYSGMALKKNGVYYTKIKNTEFVTFKKYSLKISHEEKAAIVYKIEVPESPISILTTLKDFKVTLDDSNAAFFICEFVPKKVTQVMITKLKLHIAKDDYRILKQEVFTLERMEVEDSKGNLIRSTPRIEVLYSPRKKLGRADDALVNPQNYFSETSSGIVPARRLKNYTFY